jgi:hypothetical protein
MLQKQKIKTSRSKKVQLFARGMMFIVFCAGMGITIGYLYAILDPIFDPISDPFFAAQAKSWDTMSHYMNDGALNGTILGCLGCVLHFIWTHPSSRPKSAETLPVYNSTNTWPPPPTPPAV